MENAIPVHTKHDGVGEVKHRGFKVTLDDRGYVIPPLTLGQLSEFKEYIAEQRATTTKTKYEQMLASIPMLLSAFIRNYPAMTEAALLDLIDLESWTEVVNAVFNVSGLLAKMNAAGEANQPAS